MTSKQRDDLLLEIQTTQREILRRLDALLPAPDNEAQADLLREIQRAAKGSTFRTCDVVLAAAIAVEAGDPRLRDAIIKTVGEINTRKIGNFLAGIEGHTLAGLTIRRVRATRDGITWKVDTPKM